MLMCDADSPYSYGAPFEKQLQQAGLSVDDVNKIKIWNSGYPKEPEKGTCSISAWRSVIQNDDADQQTSGSTSRDMGNLVGPCLYLCLDFFLFFLFFSPGVCSVYVIIFFSSLEPFLFLLFVRLLACSNSFLK